MAEVSIRSPAGVLLVGATLVCTVLFVAGPGAKHDYGPAGQQATTLPDDARCPGSGQVPAADVAATRQIVVCLLNAQRRVHGLAPLREQAQLEVAAQRQSDDIARRHFFAHVNPDGITPAERIAAAGYPRSPAVGENLAWGNLTEATPVRIVVGWMHSPGHRANILHGQYSEIGVGVTPGAPREGIAGGPEVYATTFGSGPLDSGRRSHG
jgi:uncharacterized protein YkwD